MKTRKLWALPLALALVALSAFVGVTLAGADDTVVRWDIVHIDTTTSPPSVRPGGHASARANDGSKITLTGHGTFEPGESDNVTGGGRFETFDAAGHSTGTGTYKVKGLVRFDKAHGGIPAGGLNDRIGRRKDAHSGLAIMKIKFSDGAKGILVVSCELEGAPHEMFEGITATWSFVDFWNREAPSGDPFVDANRTLFHIES